MKISDEDSDDEEDSERDKEDYERPTKKLRQTYWILLPYDSGDDSYARDDISDTPIPAKITTVVQSGPFIKPSSDNLEQSKREQQRPRRSTNAEECSNNENISDDTTVKAGNDNGNRDLKQQKSVSRLTLLSEKTIDRVISYLVDDASTKEVIAIRGHLCHSSIFFPSS